MVSEAEYRALSELRYRIRRFLVFSEGAAHDAGVEPKQHQLLLALRGLPVGEPPTIRRVAERLQIRHNSAVELVARSEARGLVKKQPCARDKREVLLVITARGRRVLERLTVAHRAELRRAGPALMGALSALEIGT